MHELQMLHILSQLTGMEQDAALHTPQNHFTQFLEIVSH